MSSWTCQVCTLVNEEGSAKCSACQTPRKDIATHSQQQEQRWLCVQCTYARNVGGACEMCGSPRSNSGVATNASLRWACGVCTLENEPGSSACSACRTSKPGAEPWTCLSCTMTNPGDAKNCSMCSMPKPKDKCRFKGPISARRLSQCDEKLTACLVNRLKSNSIPSEAHTNGIATHILSFSSVWLPSAIVKGSERFREFCLQELCDNHARIKFEMIGILNFSPNVELLPLLTTGDGNCLLHATSLSMWGMHDWNRSLRSHIATSIANANARSIYYDRWHTELVRQQLNLPAEFRVFRDFDAEWEQAVALPQRHNDDVVSNRRVGIFGSSLQGIHVYVLAQVLRRPIIVYGYDDLDARESGDSMTGIYLPSQWSSNDRIREPICIGSMTGHFFSLVPASGLTTHIPLCKNDGSAHPIRYEQESVQEGFDRVSKLREYLDIIETNGPNGHIFAKVTESAETVPDETKKAIDLYLTRATERFGIIEALD